MCRYKDKWFMAYTEHEALQARERYKNALLYAQLDALEPPTVEDYAARWLPLHKPNISPKCAADYRCQLDKLTPAMGHKRLPEVTVDDAAAVWLQFTGMSASLIKRARMLYIALFDTAIENGLCQKNPFRARFAQPPKAEAGSHRCLTQDEIALIRACTHRFRVPVLIMLYCGLRRGEVLALTSRDIDLKRGVIHVKRAVRFVSNRPEEADPKTAAGSRDVPIPTILRPELKDLHGLVAVSASGAQMSETAFRRAWAGYLHALSTLAGHPVSIRPHDLRHTYCTMLRDAGVDIKQAMLWMGHSDEKMILRIYDHVREERTKKAAQQLDSYLAVGRTVGSSAASPSTPLDK